MYIYVKSELRAHTGLHYYKKNPHTHQAKVGRCDIMDGSTTTIHLYTHEHLVWHAVPVLGQFAVGLGAGSRSSLVSLAATPASSCM